MLLSAMVATVVVNIRAREKEIAVRSALGASASRLRWEAIRGPTVGILVGVAVSLASSSFLLDWAGRSAVGLSMGTFLASALLTACACALALQQASRSLFRASLLSLLKESRST
jgi:cell division protein FtsX